MPSHALGFVVTSYRKTLSPFLEGQNTSEQDVLNLLIARDAIHLELEQTPLPRAYLLNEIRELDRQLKDQALELTTQLDFGTYRQSFPKPTEQWWWFLDELLKPSTHPSHWIFKGATTLAWAISIGLLLTISGRFLLGGAGVAGLSAVALSNLLTLLKARSDLTDAGDEGAKVLFERFNVSQPWQVRIRFASTALLTSTLFAFWLTLPTISKYYNRQGYMAQTKGKLGAAEQNYKRAISLNSDNTDAHYNLGILYEDIQDLEKARTEYLIAVRGNLPEAYNNLARLYLQSPDPDLNKSIALLNQGLKLADEQQSYPEVQYSLYKNLGWAFFHQEDYKLAKSALKTAISISEQPEAQGFINNPGSVHCLMAQTLELEKQTNNLSSWQRCCQLGDQGIPEENAWLRLARQRLESENLDYDASCRPTAAPI